MGESGLCFCFSLEEPGTVALRLFVATVASQKTGLSGFFLGDTVTVCVCVLGSALGA